MKKRFIAKNRKKKRKQRSILFCFCVFVFFLFSFKFMINHYQNILPHKESFEFLFSSGMGKTDFFDILNNNPTEYFFSSAMGTRIIKSESIFEEEIESGPIYEYVPDPKKEEEMKNPIIYLYNTHQTEGYKKEGQSEYDITPTVLFANYYLREKLNHYNLPTHVETTDISTILKVNGWNYGYSYEASRYLVQDAIKQHPSIRYFFDIHRDSVGYDKTTVEANGKTYARVLFVIGKEHENYEQNLAFANELSERLKSKISTISRGVITKEGKNVNGIYNQDLNPHVLLLEIGGKDNSISEVTNTMELLAMVLKEYIEVQE